MFKLHRLVASIILIFSSGLITFSHPVASALKVSSAVATPTDPVVVPFQNCSDVVISECIVSVRYKDSETQFAGKVSTNSTSINCDGKFLDQSKATDSAWCFQDSIPAYSTNVTQFAEGFPGFKVLIAKSPNKHISKIQFGPGYSTETFITQFQPVILNRAAGPGVNGEKIVSPYAYQQDDEWTIKVNFGSAPPPNFFAQAQVDSYLTSYDSLGNTIMEIKIRPIVLTRPSNGQDCTSQQGGRDDLTIGLAVFRNTMVEADAMRKLFRFTNGFSVAFNSICTFGMFRIANDGTIETQVSANHLRADGNLYEGYFSAIVSPLALQGFNVSPDLVANGGLKVVRNENGTKTELAHTITAQPDGSIQIKAVGYHYSAGSISLTRNKKISLPSKRTSLSAKSGALNVGRPSSVLVNAKNATGRVHISLVGRQGQKWSLGSNELSQGSTVINFVVPPKFPRGKTNLNIWYEGSNTFRPATKTLKVTVR